MKKVDKICFTSMVILFLIELIIYIVLKYFQNYINEFILPKQFFYKIVFAIPVIIIIIYSIWLLIGVVLLIKRAYGYIKYFDKEPFKKIDKYRFTWEDNNKYYIKRIRVINFYYADKGEVDKLVEEKRLKDLYERKEFLSLKADVSEEVVENYKAFFMSIMSIISAEILNFIDHNEKTRIIFINGIIVLTFLGIVVIKYLQSKYLGSLNFMVDEYESRLLDEKIEKCVVSEKINSMEETVLSIQQDIIAALIRKRKLLSRKEKNIMEQDIIEIQNLELCLGDYSNYYMYDCEIIIKNELRKISLPCDRKITEHFKENMLNIENYLVGDYRIFYNKLEKYAIVR